MNEGCDLPAFAARCVRPSLGAEGAGEGEPTLKHHSPAREVDGSVLEIKREKVGGFFSFAVT